MPGLASRSVPFVAGCEMLGLHKEPDVKVKPGLLVNRAKLIYAAVTFAVFALVVCLTVLSITSQKSKTIAGIQVTNFFDEDGKSPSNSQDNSTSTELEASTEALKYLVVSHPRRSKSVDVPPPWYRPPQTAYSDGSYAQLETYRNAKKVHSVSDILRYMHGERNSPVKLKGVWVKSPMNPDSNAMMKPPYHTDNLNMFNPTNPSEVNMLATKTHSNHGPRFSTKSRPTIGPFKPLPEYPSHTQAIFHPYSLENGNEENVKSNHKLKPIGGKKETDEHGEKPLKPFSVLLDIYPVATTPRPKDRTKIIRSKVVPLHVKVPTISHVHIRPGRPPVSSPQPTPQRMLLHLNLYPKKKNKNGINGKSQPDLGLNNPTLDTQLRSDVQELYDDTFGSSSLSSPAVYIDPKSSNFTNTTITRVLRWCNHYEDDLIKEKSVFFITILRSFCKNFDARDGLTESSESKTSLEEETNESSFGKYAKLTQELVNVTEYPQISEIVSSEKIWSNSSLETTPSSESQEYYHTIDTKTPQVNERKHTRRRGRPRKPNINKINSTEHSSPTFPDSSNEPPPPNSTESMKQ